MTPRTCATQPPPPTSISTAKCGESEHLAEAVFGLSGGRFSGRVVLLPAGSRTTVREAVLAFNERGWLGLADGRSGNGRERFLTVAQDTV